MRDSEWNTRIREGFGAGLALILFSVSTQARADWQGKGEAGLLISRGNAEATSGNVKLDMSEEFNRWKNSASFSGLYGRNASFSTAQRIEGKWQTDYKLTSHAFWFGSLRAEQDRFSGFAYQATAATGAGYDFIANPSTQLTGLIGAGYRRLRPEILVQTPEGEVISRTKEDSSGQGVATVGLNYSHSITKTTKVVDKFSVETGAINTSLANDLAIQVSVTDTLALSVGYGVRYNSAPPVGSVPTDQLTTVNLVYQIK